MKLDPPLVFFHVRISVAGLDVEQLKHVRNVLVQLAESVTPEKYAIRIKRRQVSRAKAERLFAAYEKREAEGPTFIHADGRRVSAQPDGRSRE